MDDGYEKRLGRAREGPRRRVGTRQYSLRTFGIKVVRRIWGRPGRGRGRASQSILSKSRIPTSELDVRRRRLEELASRENAVAVAVQAREGIAERRAARREPRDGRILVVRHAQSLVVARPPRVPRLERLRRDGGLGGNQMWGRRRAESSRKLSARRRGGAGRLPLDAASAAASSPRREFLKCARLIG